MSKLEMIGDFAVHPAASAFPMIDGAEYQALVNDIRVNGLIDPIWAIPDPFDKAQHADDCNEDLGDECCPGVRRDPEFWREHDCWKHAVVGCTDCYQYLDASEVECVLDGRNRLRACIDADVSPVFRRYEGSDPVGFVVSLNIHRRHLTESQRAMIAARLATLPKGVRADRQDPSIDGSRSPTQSQAAALMNVGEASVGRAREVIKKGAPELVAAVDRGDVAVSRAAELSKLTHDEQRREIDPAYGNSRVAGTVSGSDAYNSDEWYTPIEIVDAARQVLGGFDLDPATCEHAQKRIKAKRFYTKDDDGLSKEWNGRVWLNPPYSQPAASQFAEKLIAEVKAGNVKAAILVQNASTDTGWFHSLAQSSPALCLTKGRINFDREDGKGSQNRYGQVFFYFGEDRSLFEAVFSKFGLVGRLRGAL